MIRAVIYKDLRQHWPWLLGATLLVVAQCTMSMARWPAGVNWQSTLLPFFGSYYTRIGPTPPLVRLADVYFLACVYGAVLGLVHGLSDTRATSDFFLHRPCSRTRLAVAQLLGGSLLYWLPGLLTTGLMTAWAAVGTFACPFRAWMAVVPLVSWWTGYGFYLAATTSAWRRGRWFGPRVLPLTVSLAIAALVLNLHSLALVVMVIVLFTVIFWIVNVYLLERLGR